MSMDSVDDLEHAEDLLGSVGMLGDYCRPTCRAEGADHDDGDSDLCGCPCHVRADVERDEAAFELGG